MGRPSILAWASEPISSLRRLAVDVAVITVLGTMACLALQVAWGVVPTLLLGRVAIAGLAAVLPSTRRPSRT